MSENLPNALVHPLEALPCLQEILQKKNPRASDLENLRLLYDRKWTQVSPSDLSVLEFYMGEARPIISSLQKALRERFFSPESLQSIHTKIGQEALEWRQRLHRWNPDPSLKTDLLYVVRYSVSGEQVAHAAGLLSRIAGDRHDLQRLGHAITDALLSRMSGNNMEKYRQDENIRLLAAYAKWNGNPEIIDAAVVRALKQGMLQFDGKMIELIGEMYKKYRPQLEHGVVREQSTPLAGTLEQAYTQMEQVFPKGRMFPALPPERLTYYREQVVGLLLDVMKHRPASMTNEHALLMRNIMETLPQDRRLFWKNHLGESMRNYMNRMDISAEQRVGIYKVLGTYVAEKVQFGMWLDAIERHRLEQVGNGARTRMIPSAQTGMIPKGRLDENFVLENMIKSTPVQSVVRFVGDTEIERQLPRRAILATIEHLQEYVSTLPWWKETPSKLLVNRLSAEINPGMSPPDTRGVPIGQWTQYLDGLPVLTGWDHQFRLLYTSMTRGQDPKLSEKIHERINFRTPSEIMKDSDPLVFHLVPRPEGLSGQKYFGFLFEQLAERTQTDPQRYIPYARQVISFLDEHQLLKSLDKPEVVTACWQSREIANDILVRLNHFSERSASHGEPLSPQLEKHISRMRQLLGGAQLSDEATMLSPANSPQPSSVTSDTVRVIPPHGLRPGGLGR